jgi:rare lipoprotein A (peptidoglycan hydrolase)
MLNIKWVYAQDLKLQNNLLNQGLESGILEVVPVTLPNHKPDVSISNHLPSDSKIHRTEPLAISQQMAHLETNMLPLDSNLASAKSSTSPKNLDHPNHPNRSHFYAGKVIDGKITYYKRGKRTANGEKFDFNGMTAAHAFLPFNTIVKVTNLRNQKSVQVRINDRCSPKFKIIDLAMGAGKKIDMLRSGVIQGKMEIVQLGNGQTHYQKSKKSKKNPKIQKSKKSKA